MKNMANFIIDAIMFLVMLAIAGIGFLMKWVLLPGKEAAELYGGPVELSFLGLDRHQWGDVHLWIGLVLLALLALHIALHWKQALHLFCKLIPIRSARIVIAIIFVVVALGLIAFPLVVRPEVAARERGGGSGGHGGGRFGVQVEDQGVATRVRPGHEYQENPGLDQGAGSS